MPDTLESLRARIELLEKQEAARAAPEAYDAFFQPNVLDSKALAKDTRSGGQYVPRHPMNPYPVGREPGQVANPMVLAPGGLSQLPATQSLMRACCNDPHSYAGHLEEIPVSYVTLSYIYDVLMVMEEYLDIREGDDPTQEGYIPETIEMERAEILAMFNTLNAVLCLNVPLLREKFLFAEKADPATRRERVTELGVELKVLREERLRRVTPSLQVDTLSQETSTKLLDTMGNKQLTAIAKMLAESLPLLDKGGAGGSGKNASGLSAKERQELKELRRFAAKHRQSNKKGGKGEDG